MSSGDKIALFEGFDKSALNLQVFDASLIELQNDFQELCDLQSDVLDLFDAYSFCRMLLSGFNPADSKVGGVADRYNVLKDKFDFDSFILNFVD